MRRFDMFPQTIIDEALASGSPMRAGEALYFEPEPAFKKIYQDSEEVVGPYSAYPRHAKDPHQQASEHSANAILPVEAQARKDIPLARGVLDYFPNALAAVAEVSRIGNEQHNPGEPMHWAKDKSTDHADSLLRHLIERGTRDRDGARHRAKVAWRALADLETEILNEREAGEDENCG